MIDGTRKFLSVHTKESLGKKESEWKKFDVARMFDFEYYCRVLYANNLSTYVYKHIGTYICILTGHQPKLK